MARLINDHRKMVKEVVTIATESSKEINENENEDDNEQDNKQEIEILDQQSPYSFSNLPVGFPLPHPPINHLFDINIIQRSTLAIQGANSDIQSNYDGSRSSIGGLHNFEPMEMIPSLSLIRYVPLILQIILKEMTGIETTSSSAGIAGILNYQNQNTNNPNQPLQQSPQKSSNTIEPTSVTGTQRTLTTISSQSSLPNINPFDISGGMTSDLNINSLIQTQSPPSDLCRPCNLISLTAVHCAVVQQAIQLWVEQDEEEQRSNQGSIQFGDKRLNNLGIDDDDDDDDDDDTFDIKPKEDGNVSVAASNEPKLIRQGSTFIEQGKTYGNTSTSEFEKPVLTKQYLKELSKPPQDTQPHQSVQIISTEDLVYNPVALCNVVDNFVTSTVSSPNMPPPPPTKGQVVQQNQQQNQQQQSPNSPKKSPNINTNQQGKLSGDGNNSSNNSRSNLVPISPGNTNIQFPVDEEPVVDIGLILTKQQIFQLRQKLSPFLIERTQMNATIEYFMQCTDEFDQILSQAGTDGNLQLNISQLSSFYLPQKNLTPNTSLINFSKKLVFIHLLEALRLRSLLIAEHNSTERLTNIYISQASKLGLKLHSISLPLIKFEDFEGSGIQQLTNLGGSFTLGRTQDIGTLQRTMNDTFGTKKAPFKLQNTLQIEKNDGIELNDDPGGGLERIDIDEIKRVSGINDKDEDRLDNKDDAPAPLGIQEIGQQNQINKKIGQSTGPAQKQKVSLYRQRLQTRAAFWMNPANYYHHTNFAICDFDRHMGEFDFTLINAPAQSIYQLAQSNQQQQQKNQQLPVILIPSQNSQHKQSQGDGKSINIGGPGITRILGDDGLVDLRATLKAEIGQRIFLEVVVRFNQIIITQLAIILREKDKERIRHKIMEQSRKKRLGEYRQDKKRDRSNIGSSSGIVPASAYESFVSNILILRNPRRHFNSNPAFILSSLSRYDPNSQPQKNQFSSSTIHQSKAALIQSDKTLS
ncbi:MAG: hypothetical protein EZS28_003117 [Streblomastix strix]|uniref:Uncharacterized protein n=1 Tax=Streblomastix strix TaxID=222440 RepID=A0A5J4X3M7_9EUKA|nr:MAG: hypothetical protein EZS28_003117 [Streblomastix strix]